MLCSSAIMLYLSGVMLPLSGIMQRLCLGLLASGCWCLVAQAQSENPYAVLSISDQEANQGAPKRSVEALTLRANNELPFYVYVHNPGSEARENLFVVLAADERGEQILAEGKLDSIAARETKRVALVASQPAGTASSQAATGTVKGTATGTTESSAAGTATSNPALAATSLPRELHLLLFRTTDENTRRLLTSPRSRPKSVRIMSPKEYLQISTAIPPGIKAKTTDLYVQLAGESSSGMFRGKPCRVTLNIRPDLIPELDPSAPREGTYEAFVAPGSEGITLAATNLRFLGENKRGIVTVSADGIADAFVFQVDFSGTSPRPLEDRSFVRIRAPEAVITGKPLEATLEFFGDNISGRPRLLFYRSNVGSPQVLSEHLNTVRDERLTYRIGDKGELLAAAVVNNWTITLDTAGLYGKRKLVYEVIDSDFPIQSHEKEITFDDSPPRNVAFTEIPKTVDHGKTFRVVARAEEPESDLKPDGVIFYIGDKPEEGKKPARGSMMIGKRNQDGSYTADFRVPEVNGSFDVTVQFTNQVGLSSSTSAEISVIPRPTTGAIEGRIIQGNERAQPGLVVQLLDTEDKVLLTAKTNEQGRFAFKELKPGTYRIACKKPVDYNASGSAEAVVAAGETTKLPDISLKR